MKESSAGYHFMNLYQNCAWKFFIKYILGLIPMFSSPALLFGAAIHAAVAAFLMGKDYQLEFRRCMREEKDGYQKEDEYVLDSNRGLVLLATWVAEVGNGFKSDYHVLAAESELEVPLRNGYRVTARPDACFVPRSKREAPKPPVYILETKTTRWGRDLVEETLQNADQITTYIWATKKAHPSWNVQGVIPNIMYQNKSKVGVGLGDLIIRTEQDLKDYEEQLMGLLTEISQKVLGLKKGFDKHALFPRNTSWCGSYNRPCEYISICRDCKLGIVPHGFKKEDWGEREVVEEVVNAKASVPSVRVRRNGSVGADDEASQYPIDFGDTTAGTG